MAQGGQTQPVGYQLPTLGLGAFWGPKQVLHDRCRIQVADVHRESQNSNTILDLNLFCRVEGIMKPLQDPKGQAITNTQAETAEIVVLIFC